jgi:phosphate:Na+ symporter
VFGKTEKTKNIALAMMGFSLIFYGLNLMTGGLKPLRAMPEVMSVISTLNAQSFGGLIACVLTAAFITALIHSSSASALPACWTGRPRWRFRSAPIWARRSPRGWPRST